MLGSVRLIGTIVADWVGLMGGFQIRLTGNAHETEVQSAWPILADWVAVMGGFQIYLTGDGQETALQSAS